MAQSPLLIASLFDATVLTTPSDDEEAPLGLIPTLLLPDVDLIMGDNPPSQPQGPIITSPALKCPCMYQSAADNDDTVLQPTGRTKEQEKEQEKAQIHLKGVTWQATVNKIFLDSSTQRASLNSFASMYSSVGGLSCKSNVSSLQP
jgi:hypothetical protein